jgi:hypothetical protein
MRALPAVLLLVAFAGCDKSEPATQEPEPETKEVVAPKPTPALVEGCIDRLAKWSEIRDKPAPEDDAQLQGIKAECGVLYAKCGSVDTAAVFVAGGNRTRSLELVDQCLTAYCGGFGDPKPSLCASGKATLMGKDKEAARKGALEFHAAMLVMDVQADAAALQVATERLADPWTGYGEVDLSAVGDSVSVAFEVHVNAKGFELRTGEPVAWKTKPEPKAAKLELPLLDPKKAKKGAAADAVDPNRWDYDTLAKEAAALKAAFPEESSVTLVVDEKVPTEVQTRTMNALRGKGCKLDANARPTTVPPECVYWRQILR